MGQFDGIFEYARRIQAALQPHWRCLHCNNIIDPAATGSVCWCSDACMLAGVGHAPPPVCAYCAQPDGYHDRHLVSEPVGYTTPMHQECMDDIARWGCD